MAALKNKPRRPRISAQKNGQSPSIADSIHTHLSVIPAVEAAFMTTEYNVVHVFTVTAEHQSRIYKKLMKQEALVEQEHPGVAFDFHTRVHQGRPVHRAVPFDAVLVFSK